MALQRKASVKLVKPGPVSRSSGPCWKLEKSFHPEGVLVAGIDEAGRGCLAGPVCAAAVILPLGFVCEYLNDSKQIVAEKRLSVAEKLKAHPEVVWGIGFAEVVEIDELNILQATYLAMARAVAALSRAPGHYLIDGKTLPPKVKPATAIIEGDGKCPSIAAASILAKTSRDALMAKIHLDHPVYGFAKHKGYGTKEHLSALTHHGPCSIHRTSFRPVRLATRTPELSGHLDLGELWGADCGPIPGEEISLQSLGQELPDGAGRN